MTAILDAPAAGPAAGRATRDHTITGAFEARDRAILELTAAGRTRIQTARLLHLGGSSVDISKTRIKHAYDAPNMPAAVARALARGDLRPSARLSPAPPLADLQRLVCLLIAEGLSNQGIAHRSGLAPDTVAGFVRRLMAALGAGRRPRLVMEAYRCGVLVADAGRSHLVLAGGGPR